MLYPITQYRIIQNNHINFKNSEKVNSQNSYQENINNNLNVIAEQTTARNNITKKLALGISCLSAAFLIPYTMNSILNYTTTLQKLANNKKAKETVIKEFQSLQNDTKVPILSECKSISPSLKDFLQQQVDYLKAGKDIIAEVGNPEMANRLMLYGNPGTGKSFFAKILAKTLNADYMEVRHSDFNSQWAGEGTEKLTKIFETILKEAKDNPDKKYVVTFNEIDTIIQPVEKISNSNGGSYFLTKLEQRSAFLNYIDELSEKTSNVIIVGTSNLSANNQGLDKAALSRFKNNIEVPMPNKECLKEALKMNLKNIKGIDEFMNTNSKELDNFSQNLVDKGYSFRNLEHIVEKSKTYYMSDKLKDKNTKFDFKYLNKALENISVTDGIKH